MYYFKKIYISYDNNNKKVVFSRILLNKNNIIKNNMWLFY